MTASEARAQTCNTNWADCNRAFTSSGTGQSAVAAALRAWGPSDEVFVVYETRDLSTAVHRLFLRGYTCQNADCSSYDLTNDESANHLGNTIKCDTFLMPGISVTAAGSQREVDMVVRTRADRIAPNCASTTVNYADASCGTASTGYLDLDHIQWDTTGAESDDILEWSSTEFSGTHQCEDRARAFLRTNATNNRMRACWRYNDEPANGLDQVHCGKETTGAYQLDELSNVVADDPRVQEHVAMDLDDDDRIAIHRSDEDDTGDDFTIRMRFVEDTADPDVVLKVAEHADHPDFVISSTGRFWAVWTEGTGTGSTMHLKTCFPSMTVDCKSDGDWDDAGNLANVDDSEAFTGKDLAHPNILTDGEQVFLVFMEDDPAAGTQNRVRFTSRCGVSGPFGPVETILTPATFARDQSLFHGRPNLGADRVANRVHAAFVEGDQIHSQTEQATDGDVWWASRAYLDNCP